MFDSLTSPGVGAASLLALKSQVIKKQHEAREATAGEEALSALRHAKRRGVFEGSNPGVADRDRRDRLDVKVRIVVYCHFSVNSPLWLSGKETRAKKCNRQRLHAFQSPGDLLDASRAALERKAELYKRLASGQGASRDELESYEVDFLLKGATGMLNVTGNMISRDMAMERERRAWEAEAEANYKSEREQLADERRAVRYLSRRSCVALMMRLPRHDVNIWPINIFLCCR